MVKFKHVKKSGASPFDDAVAIPLNLGDSAEKKKALRDRIAALEKEIGEIGKEERDIAQGVLTEYLSGKTGYPKGKLVAGIYEYDFAFQTKGSIRMVARYHKALDGKVYLNVAKPEAVGPVPKTMTLNFA